MPSISPGASIISADVTSWSGHQRLELLEKIDAINEQVQVQSAPALQAGAGGPQDVSALLPSSPGGNVRVPDDVESTGWTYPAYEQAIIALLRKHSVQVSAIFEAIKSGTGYITRGQVYALGKYPESRSLKGFTRPVNRVTADLVDSGKLPEDAEELLRPDYDPAVRSFQRARGFFVPMEVVKLALEAKVQRSKEDPLPAVEPESGAATGSSERATTR